VFLLDTDHLGIVQRRSAPEHPTLTRRMRQHSLEGYFVSIVSFHEQVNGWNAYIRRARGVEGLVRGYGMFEGILADFARLNVVPFTAAAAERALELRRSGLRVGTMDLRRPRASRSGLPAMFVTIRHGAGGARANGPPSGKETGLLPHAAG
jgi:tRNA(fMet)-specific endonuclease VapC